MAAAEKVRPETETLVVLLVEARELVRRGWTRGAYARRRSSWAPNDWLTLDELPEFVDAAGAIGIVGARHGLPSLLEEQLRALVLAAVPVELLVRAGGGEFALEHVNDCEGVTKAEVLGWFDLAIRSLS